MQKIQVKTKRLHRVAVSGGAIITSGKGICFAKKPEATGKTVFCHVVNEIITVEEGSLLIDLVTGDDSEKCISTCYFGCL